MIKKKFIFIISSLLILSGCLDSETINENNKEITYIASTAIVADIISVITGKKVNSIIPNGFDSHTYMPSAKELAIIDDADYIIVPDENLNSSLTGLLKLSKNNNQIIDLNKLALNTDDIIIKDNKSNPHTWTSLSNMRKWSNFLLNFIVKKDNKDEKIYKENYNIFITELDKLEESITKSSLVGKKIVVYHDAWDYFGKEYNINIIGAIQARNFVEPTAKELSLIIKQIKDENVKSFFGSEVYPSDILDIIERDSGAKYISELSDDVLPKNSNFKSKSLYLEMMQMNINNLKKGL